MYIVCNEITISQQKQEIHHLFVTFCCYPSKTTFFFSVPFVYSIKCYTSLPYTCARRSHSIEKFVYTFQKLWNWHACHQIIVNASMLNRCCASHTHFQSIMIQVIFMPIANSSYCVFHQFQAIKMQVKHLALSL